MRSREKECLQVYAANGDIKTIGFEEVLLGGEVMVGLEVRMGAVLGL